MWGLMKVERWLTKRIPLVYKHARQHPDWKNMQIHFEFWATGKLSDEAVAMIKKTHVRATKYSLTYRDADMVYAYAQTTKDVSLIKTLGQHFLKHPMATAEEDAKRRVSRKIHGQGSFVSKESKKA